METIKLIIDRGRWMAGIERANLQIISPTGKSIFITKWNLGKLTETESQLVWFLADYNSPVEYYATREQMEVLRQCALKTK